MVDCRLLHPRATPDHIGAIPYWLDERNPAPAKAQLNAAYGHGGGWRHFNGFKFLPDDSIKYPGDPAMKPIAEMWLRNERILMYEHAWVLIAQLDRSFEICRMD